MTSSFFRFWLFKFSCWNVAFVHVCRQSELYVWNDIFYSLNNSHPKMIPTNNVYMSFGNFNQTYINCTHIEIDGTSVEVVLLKTIKSGPSRNNRRKKKMCVRMDKRRKWNDTHTHVHKYTQAHKQQIICGHVFRPSQFFLIVSFRMFEADFATPSY